MPLRLFDFKCQVCGHVDEHLCQADQTHMHCPVTGCNGLAEKIVSLSTRVEAFRPGYYDIDVEPVYIDNKRQLKRELDERNLTSFYTHG